MGRLKTNFVGKGHVLSVLKKFPDESIDCIITSPPYWKLRNYNTADIIWEDSGRGVWRGQLGQEPIIGMFIEHLILIFNELRRVLKKSGSCFVVFGDTSSVGGNVGSGEYKKRHKQFGRVVNLDAAPALHSTKELPPKCLCMIPERFALSMLSNKWTLRNTCILHKPSVMPSSVKDRFTVSHESIFFFVKNKKYFFNQSFEPCVGSQNGEVRNRRTVWSISAGKYKGAHFAVFPPELCRIIIEAGCPEGGVVLDPFCGSGTALVVAKQLGRKYIGIDNSREYVDMSRKRLADG